MSGEQDHGVMVPYPLRRDFIASVDVPRDMTLAEAERLAAFVRTLATDRPTGGKEDAG